MAQPGSGSLLNEANLGSGGVRSGSVTLGAPLAAQISRGKNALADLGDDKRLWIERVATL